MFKETTDSEHIDVEEDASTVLKCTEDVAATKTRANYITRANDKPWMGRYE